MRLTSDWTRAARLPHASEIETITARAIVQSFSSCGKAVLRRRSVKTSAATFVAADMKAVTGVGARPQKGEGGGDRAETAPYSRRQEERDEEHEGGSTEEDELGRKRSPVDARSVEVTHRSGAWKMWSVIAAGQNESARR